jgi:hypothetical protein
MPRCSSTPTMVATLHFFIHWRKTTLILRPIEAENGRRLRSTTQAMGFYE